MGGLRPPLVCANGPGKRRLGASSALGLTMLLACSSVCAGTESGTRAGATGTIDFKQEPASAEVRRVADWVVDSADNHGMPYVIIDKINAKVFVFDIGGKLQGAAPALLGLRRGDRSVAGIGERKMSSIRPADRITPAGRFLASLDHDVHGGEILLIDYADSIALHPVIKGTPAEHRARRLESATSQDNRISFGCINVPAKFYEDVVSPAFTHSNGLVYILPETSAAGKMFGMTDFKAGKNTPALP